MSIVQVMSSSSGGKATDRTSFIGARVPQEVKHMVKRMKKLDKAIFRKLLQVAVSALEDRPVSPTTFKELESDTLDEETIAFLYSGLLSLLRAALRIPQTSVKQELFKEDLQELNIPAEFIPDICSAVYGARRPMLEKATSNARPSLPKLTGFKWRVDVAISTSVLSRALEPTVVMEMSLSNGVIKQFEMPISKFHELRYNVAYVLKEMEDLEKRSILKIQD